MEAQTELEDAIRRQVSPLLSPAPLAHSQELKDGLPPVRRYVGPRAWYQALETSVPPVNTRPNQEFTGRTEPGSPR